LNKVNRRPTQTVADSIFSLADMARENLHAFRANRFLQRQYNVGIASLDNNLVLYRLEEIINREAIDVYWPARSAGIKVCVRLRSSAVKYKKTPGDYKCAF
jgi:hypothetical protein